MKQQFIEASTAKKAREIAPWADKIVKVEGGYMAFESARDWETWKKQK